MNEFFQSELDRITRERDYYNQKTVKLKIEQKNHSDYEKLWDMFCHVNRGIDNIERSKNITEERLKLEICTIDVYLKKISAILENYN